MRLEAVVKLVLGWLSIAGSLDRANRAGSIALFWGPSHCLLTMASQCLGPSPEHHSDLDSQGLPISL